MALTLATDRLILRPPDTADLPAVARGLADFEVARWLPRVPYPYGDQHARDWLETVPAEPLAHHAIFAIAHADHGVIGCISVVTELGYWLARPFWGRGLMTEAVRAVLDWHFAQGANAVAAGALEGNAASLAIQHKFGFVETARRRIWCNALECEVGLIDTSLTREGYRRAAA